MFKSGSGGVRPTPGDISSDSRGGHCRASAILLQQPIMSVRRVVSLCVRLFDCVCLFCPFFVCACVFVVLFVCRPLFTCMYSYISTVSVCLSVCLHVFVCGHVCAFACVPLFICFCVCLSSVR